jgi:L-2-hydroxyglutarate oxidase LhgO
LLDLQRRASANGVAAELWSAEQVRLRQPALRCTEALWSPSTGIIDSHAFMLSLQGDLENAGGIIAFNTTLSALSVSDDAMVFTASDGTDSPTQLRTKYLVNAAGLSAPDLARRFVGLDPARVPPAYYAKGNYFTLAGRAPFSRLIYPVPEAAGLGVHLTLDMGGQAKFGPDVEWVTSPDDLGVDPRRADGFYAEVRKYWPGLKDGALQAGYAGIRPKIQAPHEAAKDFVIQGPAEHGVAGLVNLFGIESPGLTSSLAIGAHIVQTLGCQN